MTCADCGCELIPSQIKPGDETRHNSIHLCNLARGKRIAGLLRTIADLTAEIAELKRRNILLLDKLLQEREYTEKQLAACQECREWIPE